MLYLDWAIFSGSGPNNDSFCPLPSSGFSGKEGGWKMRLQFSILAVKFEVLKSLTINILSFGI
jgi:hypothetical protein